MNKKSILSVGAITFILQACGINLLPLGIEKEMGKYYDKSIIGTSEVIKSERANVYLKNLCNKITLHSRRKDIEYTYTIINSDDKYAVAFPGGYIYLSNGIIAIMDNEDELAGVLSHEIAHIALEHHGKMITGSIFFNLLLNFVLPSDINIAGIITELGSLKFSRDHEKEADKMAIEYIVKSGYNPWGLISLLNKISDYENLNLLNSISILSTHPPINERVKTITAIIGGDQSASRRATVSWGFIEFKDKVRHH